MKIWELIDILWMKQCDDQHATNGQKADRIAQDKAEASVRALDGLVDHLPEPNRHLFSQPLQELLSKPLHQVQQWIDITTLYVKAQLKKKQDWHKMQDIRMYFAPATMTEEWTAHQLSSPAPKRPLCSSQLTPSQQQIRCHHLPRRDISTSKPP